MSKPIKLSLRPITKDDIASMLGYPPGSFARDGYGPSSEDVNAYRSERAGWYVACSLIALVGGEATVPPVDPTPVRLHPIDYSKMLEHPLLRWLKTTKPRPQD